MADRLAADTNEITATVRSSRWSRLRWCRRPRGPRTVPIDESLSALARIRVSDGAYGSVGKMGGLGDSAGVYMLERFSMAGQKRTILAAPYTGCRSPAEFKLPDDRGTVVRRRVTVGAPVVQDPGMDRRP